MKVTTKKLSDTKVELSVKLDAADLKSAREKAIIRLAKELKLAGFRKGKVPLEIAEKNLNPNDINEVTVDIAVRTTVPKAFQEASKNPLVIPNVNVTKYVVGELVEYVATAEIMPEIKVGDFKNLKVKKIENKVSAKEIDEVLEKLSNAYAEKKVAKKKAALGDEVIIDFVGKKDGKEFAGGKAKDFHLTLGSKQFIPGFEDGVVGHEPGDKFELKLTFPKDYHNPDMAGVDTVFEVLLKQVNEIIKPKLDAEFAKKCGPFKSIDELKADIKKNLTAQNEYKILEKYKDDLVEELVKNSKVSAPEILIEDQMRIIRNDIEYNAKTQGMTFVDFLKQTKTSEKEWEKEAREIAEKRVKASLVLQCLADEQKIIVKDDEVSAKIAELREVYKKSPEAIKNLKNPRVRQDLANRMRIEKTLDFLIKSQK